MRLRIAERPRIRRPAQRVRVGRQVPGNCYHSVNGLIGHFPLKSNRRAKIIKWGQSRPAIKFLRRVL
jgi:hypothetical protein